MLVLPCNHASLLVYTNVFSSHMTRSIYQCCSAIVDVADEQCQQVKYITTF